uniref:receptor protein serine/threonine kinase n=1 Tax=Elaeophora elaphi TaxID=1147741 RepID=A0A158Q8S6_9BILA
MVLMKLIKLWMFEMIEMPTVGILLVGIFFLPVNGNLNEYGRKQDHDSAERYDADGDLLVPIDAQGRPYDFNSSKVESEADRKRKSSPAKYEDERSLCYCNYSPEFCGGFTNFTCIKHLEASCFHFTEEIYDDTLKQVETMHLFGCAPLTRGSGGSYFTCKAHLVAHARPKSIACCQEGNYCNHNLSVPAHVNVSPEGVIVDQYASYMTVTVIVYAALFLIFSGIALLLFWRRNFIGKMFAVVNFTAERLKPSLQKSTNQMMDTGEVEKAPMLYDVSSGSGSGFASLNQRTVAQDLQFLSVVGKGRYGEVKKARYRGDRIVAVKTFYTTEEDSWKNEKEIYQTQMLNHENILQFVAADIGSEDSITRMLLITDFHAYGSLFEYLQRGETLSVSEALHLAYSAVCGLEHLHSALHGTGTPQKPAIAHRDVKSKNIIVKRPYVCCIADFGLALTEDMVKTRTDINIQVGTKRYMAPEVLDKSLNVKNFHHFKMADIYSFALVIWEILRRIQEDNCLSRASESDSGIGSSGSGSGTAKLMPAFIINSDVSRYITNVSSNVVDHQSISDNSMSLKARPPMQPFDGMVDPDPSFEQMRRLVCLEGKRPLLEDAWIRDPCLKEICELINECWSASIDCRHTALRVKRKIKDMILKHNGLGGTQISGSNKQDCSAKALSV